MTFKRLVSNLRFVLGLFLVFFIFAVRPVDAASGHQSHPHVHKQHAKLQNPVPMSQESIRTGKTIFEKNCLFCHGSDAKGGAGPDLTDDHWIHGPSDGEIFHVISHGVAGTAMKEYKDKLSQETRWHVVNYLRSAGKKVDK